jgi:hypothetical protein
VPLGRVQAEQLSAAPDSSPYRTLAEILNDPGILDPPEVVVPRLAWRGRVTLLAAREKDGKSTLAGAGAAAVTRGAAFLDGEALHGPVVLAGFEEHPTEIATRLHAFNVDPDKLYIATRIWSDPIAELEEVVVRIRPALVIVDTLSAIAQGKIDDGSAKGWQPLMAALTKLAREFNCADLIIHHSRKSDGAYRDSTAIGANVDCIIEMHADDKDTAVRHLKARSRFPVPDCAIRYANGIYELAESVEPKVAIRSAIVGFVREHPGCSLNQLRQGIVGKSTTKGEIASALVAEGVLREEKGAQNARLLFPVESPGNIVARPSAPGPVPHFGLLGREA